MLGIALFDFNWFLFSLFFFFLNEGNSPALVGIVGRDVGIFRLAWGL